MADQPAGGEGEWAGRSGNAEEYPGLSMASITIRAEIGKAGINTSVNISTNVSIS